MSAATETRMGELDKLLDDARPDDAFAGDMFRVVDALESSASLRRAVTDPGAPESARKDLVHRLLDGKVGQAVVDLVAEAATLRWSGGRAFASALERQGVRAQLMVADRAGDLENSEDELFRLARTIEGSPELRDALGNRSIGLDRREELLGGLLSGRATDTTVVLAKRAVRARERTFAHTIEGFVTLGRGAQEPGRGHRASGQAAERQAARPVANLAEPAARSAGRSAGSHRPGRAGWGSGRAG